MKQFLQLYTKILGTRNDLPKLGAWYLAVSLIESLALLLVYPLLQALFGGDFAGAFTWFVVILVLAVVSLIAIPIGWQSLVVCCRDMSVVQRRIGEKVIHLPLGWFDAKAPARVNNAAVSCCDAISHIASVVLPNLVQCVVIPVAVSVGMLAIEWRVALVLFAAMPLLWVLDQKVDRGTARTAGGERDSSEALANRVIEFARLQPVLRAASGDKGLDRVNDALEADLHATEHTMEVKSKPVAAFGLLTMITIIIGLIVAALLWRAGDIDAPTFFTSVLLLTVIYRPAAFIPMYKAEFTADVESLRKIEAVLFAETLPEVAEDAAKQPQSSAIDVREVEFGYTPGNPVLRGVDIRIPERSVTALVGPSGCGKTTLLRLIARFWDVDSGSVTIGGVDVRDMQSAELMKQISMVMQDVYLFDSTIEDNVRLGKPDATDEEVAQAIRKARLTEVVERLPQGLLTTVGEGGRNLSGGERQRVAIARAFLKDAPILLLDEVTSSLDGANEAAVTRAIAELAQGRTVVMIAHRLSTVTRADQIVVLGSDGRVEDRGSHEELRQRSGTYTEFLEAQAAGAAWRVTEA